MMFSRRILCAALAAPAILRAQPAPFTRPLRMMVGFPGGSTPDIAARAVAEHLAQAFGQQVLTENRPGAGGTIATDIVARATDGHTVGVVISSCFTTAPALYPQLPYVPERDLAPLSLLVRAPQLLVVRPDLAANDVAGLIALARAQPGRLSYGSTGNGTASHLAMETLKAAQRIDLTHVTYRGFPQLAPDLISGRVDASFAIAAAFLPQVREGRLKALGVTAAQRFAQAADIPTLAEQGFADMESYAWIGLVSPSAMPEEARAALSAEAQRALADATRRQRLTAAGFEVVGSDAATFQAWAARETREWGALIRRLGITADG